MIDEILKTVTLLVASLAAAWARKAKAEASEANDAVNHRHEKGTPRLYDLALRNDARTDELIEWKRGYDGGPLDSGEKVVAMMEDFEAIKRLCPQCPHRDEEDDDAKPATD